MHTGLHVTVHAIRRYAKRVDDIELGGNLSKSVIMSYVSAIQWRITQSRLLPPVLGQLFAIQGQRMKNEAYVVALSEMTKSHDLCGAETSLGAYYDDGNVIFVVTGKAVKTVIIPEEWQRDVIEEYFGRLPAMVAEPTQLPLQSSEERLLPMPNWFDGVELLFFRSPSYDQLTNVDYEQLFTVAARWNPSPMNEIEILPLVTSRSLRARVNERFGVRACYVHRALPPNAFELMEASFSEMFCARELVRRMKRFDLSERGRIIYLPFDRTNIVLRFFLRIFRLTGEYTAAPGVLYTIERARNANGRIDRRLIQTPL